MTRGGWGRGGLPSPPVVIGPPELGQAIIIIARQIMLAHLPVEVAALPQGPFVVRVGLQQRGQLREGSGMVCLRLPLIRQPLMCEAARPSASGRE